MEFDVKEITRQCIYWTQQFVNDIDKDKKVIVDISGGRNSAIAAGMLEHALGKDRILGVMFSCYEDPETPAYKSAMEVCSSLGIKMQYVHINSVFQEMCHELRSAECSWKDSFPDTFDAFKVNTIARLRMTYLYGLAALQDALVVNTSDRSSSVIDYTTKFGDQVGDFAPLAWLTNDEIRQIGEYMRLPESAINAQSSDGLWCIGNTRENYYVTSSDEEKTGILYSDINQLIRNGKKGMDEETVFVIERAFEASMQKRNVLNLPTIRPELYDYFFEKYGK